jgi:hypothetical protein
MTIASYMASLAQSIPQRSLSSQLSLKMFTSLQMVTSLRNSPMNGAVAAADVARLNCSLVNVEMRVCQRF